jgi:hypothetical protein
MKQFYKFFFITILVLLSINSFAQKTKKEQREIQEIKSIFNDFANNNSILQINKELVNNGFMTVYIKLVL